MSRLALAPFLALTALAASMPVSKQNALVQKYCAGCHTDAAALGALTLEHFDAAQAPPSLLAMLASKISSGVLLSITQAAPADPKAAAFVAKKIKTGAMGASGVAIPDPQTIDALVQALAAGAKRANEWSIQSSERAVTASILREVPSSENPSQATMYRMVLDCDLATHKGGMRLTWAPEAEPGTLSVAIDAEPPSTYDVKPGTINLYALDPVVPNDKLTITNLSRGEQVVFPFGELDPSARQSLAACFAVN